jgi:GTP-binding protein
LRNNKDMDNVEITIYAGKGGDGAVSFWREKFQPFGGPDGGDGGKGGDVYCQASSNEQDLSIFRNKRVYKAENGRKGENQKKHGRDGADLYITVPIGTTIYRKESSNRLLVADLVRDGQKALLATGGRGGLGNVHFASSVRKAPREATPGKSGEKVTMILEHRLLADVCLAGLPNSGKSLLLSRMTKTSPRVADYPFTTVEPILGKSNIGFDSITVMELPALMSGSHQGKGLGNRFLRHCERSRVLLLVLDGSSDGIIKGDLELLKQELGLYDAELLNKQLIVAINKIDIVEVARRRTEIESSMASTGLKIYFVSAKTGEGVSALVTAIYNLLKKLPAPDEHRETPEFVFRPRPMTRKKP